MVTVWVTRGRSVRPEVWTLDGGQGVLTGGQVVRETLAGSRESALTVGSGMHGLEALAGSQDSALARGQGGTG